MKTILVALAALAAAGTASAQSAVTLFGVIDAAISGYKNQSQTPSGATVDTTQTAQTSSGYTGNRLGFRGTEDLGGEAQWPAAGRQGPTSEHASF